MNENRASKRPFSEEEAALVRHIKFGELPDRVLPATLVELVDTTSVQEDLSVRASDPGLWGGAGPVR